MDLSRKIPMDDIYEMVNKLTLNELHTVSLNYGLARNVHKPSESTLRTQIIQELDTPSRNDLKKDIEQVYNMRTLNPVDSLSSGPPETSSGLTLSAPPNRPDLQMIFPIKVLPFYKNVQILCEPPLVNVGNNIVESYCYLRFPIELKDRISKSWNRFKNEFKLRVILVLQLDQPLENDEHKRLPYNLKITINNTPCELPELNIPSNPLSLPWRHNVPINLTGKMQLNTRVPTYLTIVWQDRHKYKGVIYAAEKIGLVDISEELTRKPPLPSYKTKELIKKLISDNEMAGVDIDYMTSTIQDPISYKRMRLPARGVNCMHLQCFDAIQFVLMNEKKAEWLCPLCKIEIAYFDEIQVDEFYYNILQCPTLHKTCNQMIFYKNGFWREHLESLEIDPIEIRSEAEEYDDMFLVD